MNLKPWFLKFSTLVLTIILSLTIFSLPASAYDESDLSNFQHRKICMGCDLSDAQLDNLDLSGAYLYNSDLTKASLNNANLTKANLEKTRLNGATLINANLSGEDTNLKGAILVGANLSEANISEANMQDTNLKDATLKGTSLCDTELLGATMPDDTIYHERITDLSVWEVESNCPHDPGEDTN